MANKTVPDETVPKQDGTTSKWKPDSIFWGGTLVLIGILLLLNSLGVITVDIAQLWRLWPILIIAAGVSLFAPKGLIAKLCNIILLVITVLLALFVTTAGNSTVEVDGDTQSKSFSRGIAGVNLSKVTVEAGAVVLNINSEDMRNTVNAKLDSERMELKTSTVIKNGEQRDTISVSSKGFPWVPTSSSTLGVTLGEQLPTDLTLDLGASKIRGDLTNVNLRNLSLDAGASSVDMTFGDKQATQRITIDGGASSMTLRIPKALGVQVKMDAGLVNTEFDDINKVSDNLYETSGFAASERKVYISVDAGASKLVIKRY